MQTFEEWLELRTSAEPRMIELRWRLIPHYKMDDNRPVEIKRVLQYRYPTRRLRVENAIVMGLEDGMSQWKDVPEEMLDADYAQPDAAGDSDK